MGRSLLKTQWNILILINRNIYNERLHVIIMEPDYLDNKHNDDTPENQTWKATPNDLGIPFYHSRGELTEAEQKSIFKEIGPIIKRVRVENDKCSQGLESKTYEGQNEQNPPKCETWEAIPNSMGIKFYHCRSELSKESQEIMFKETAHLFRQRPNRP